MIELPGLFGFAGGRAHGAAAAAAVHPHRDQRFLAQEVSEFHGDVGQRLRPVLLDVMPNLYTLVRVARHKRQKEEDIAVCECQYNLLDPDSACGDRCLNVLTSTECTPGYCLCGVYCKNQVGVSLVQVVAQPFQILIE